MKKKWWGWYRPNEYNGVTNYGEYAAKVPSLFYASS